MGLDLYSSRQFKPFLVAYRYEGAEWNIQVPAHSYEDAKQRLTQIANGRIDGLLVGQIPSKYGLLARAIVAFRQLLGW